MRTIKSKTDISNIQEFTVECNPEDIHSDLIENLKQLGVNRVSLGLQSLNEIELKAMCYDTQIDFYHPIRCYLELHANLRVIFLRSFVIFVKFCLQK